MTVGTSILQKANYWGPAVALDPKDWFTPGNADPAVGTAGFYGMSSLLYWRPYDLAAMGSEGAAIAAVRGRYVWICSADHPGLTTLDWQGGDGFKIGFSSDPGIFPDTLTEVIPRENAFLGTGLVGYPTAGTYGRSDMFHCLVYNPEGSSGKVFYMYVQMVPGDDRGTQGGAFKSADLFTWEPVGLTHAAQVPPNITANDAGIPGVPNDNITSYQWVQRLSSGNWISLGVAGTISRLGMVKWTSTSGDGPFSFPTSVYNITATGLTAPTANFTIDQTSGTPFRLTSSSSLWTSGDTGKTLCIFGAGGNLVKGTGNAAIPRGNEITFVNASEVTLLVDNDVISAANDIPVEWGTVLKRYVTPLVSGTYTWLTNNIGCDPFSIGGTTYILSTEDARGPLASSQGMAVVVEAVDANYSATGTYTRLTPMYLGDYPGGPTYLHQTCGYLEDSILHIYVERGFSSQYATTNPGHPLLNGNFTGSLSGTTLTVTAFPAPATLPIMFVGASLQAYTGLTTGPNTEYPHVINQLTGTPGGTGTYTIIKYGSETLAAGSTFNVGGGGGGMVEQFIDYWTYPIDLTAAALAAPFGVRAACTDGTVTITWMEPFTSAQSYRIKRSTSSNMSSPTTVGTVSAATITDAPSTGFYYYQVIKMNSGVEGQARIVSTYVS